MINRVFAVCLLVQDLNKSLDFYQNQLGLSVNSTDVGFVDFKLGETSLAIFQKKDATTMFPGKFMTKPGGVVIALHVDGIKQACSELRLKGVKIFEGPKETPWGQTVAYLHDPDGYIIELTN